MLLNYWKSIEKNKKFPENLRKVKELRFDDFKKKIKNKIQSQILINNLFKGDVYLIRNTISKKIINDLKKYLVSISKSESSSFYKIKEGCPNFNRIINKKHKKYTVTSSRHVFYFFRWNKDKFNIFKKFDIIWDKVKYLNGFKFNSFKKNTPKNGLVDRIQIHRYPHNSGEIEPHQHNPKNIRIILNIYMSKKGHDFYKGGIFFKKSKKKIEIEKKYKINIGDSLIFYSTLVHSVEKVKILKKNLNKSNLNYTGRWWAGLYTPESDHVKNRITSNRVKF